MTCRFQLQCKETHSGDNPHRPVYINYTDEIIRHIVIAGLCDEDVKRDVFGLPNVDTLVIHELLNFIEGKEVAREATIAPAVNTVSQFQKNKNDKWQHPLPGKRGNCSTCGILFPLFKKMANGKLNKKPFKDYQDCWRKKNSSIQNITQEGGNDEDAVLFDLSLINGAALNTGIMSSVTYGNLSHQIFEGNTWVSKPARPHPRIDLSYSTEELDYARVDHPCPKRSRLVSAIADSGAQCCVWGLSDFLDSGFKIGDLIPVKQSLTAVSRAKLTISGACFLDGKVTASHPVFTYISPDVSGFFLSQHAMIKLGILSPNFPSVDAVTSGSVCKTNIVNNSLDIQPVKLNDCGCFKRNLPPGFPRNLPVSPCKENIP